MLIYSLIREATTYMVARILHVHTRSSVEMINSQNDFTLNAFAEYSQAVQISPTARTYDTHQIVSLMNDIARQQYIASLAMDQGNTPLFSVTIPAACCQPMRV
jgi:hypothetical protein